ncbi:protein kinase wis1 [Thermoascus aurantiacus ATCC 26904]
MANKQEPVADKSPTSPDVDHRSDSSGASSPAAPAASRASVPSLRPGPDASSGMAASSTPLGQINAARRGGINPSRPPASMGAQSSGLNQDIMAKMKAFSLSRQGAPPGGIPPSSAQVKGPVVGSASPASGQHPTPPSGPIVGGLAGRLPPTPRPHAPNWPSGPSVTGPGSAANPPKPGGLGARRQKPGLKLSDATGPQGAGGQEKGADGASTGSGAAESAFSRYSEFIDTKAGTLNFKDKAIIHGGGIEFSSGHSFSISLDEVDLLEELGKGNYGTVYKVRHSRPHLRKPGLGLRGIVSRPPEQEGSNTGSSPSAKKQDNLSGVIMALKEIRLELDEKKFSQIIMELDILHRCVSPFIIDFYGAFFQEGAVYICVEYMDGGSVDKLYAQGIPENILRKITLSTVMGLKTLKDEHNIIHRDVKPTNILINTRGQVKICDFGVSGNLVASIAKTNIGCQSYMAPERIAGGGMQQSGANSSGGTYSVQSDVWSLGLSIIECAMGRYPYPPETSTSIFSQLHAIVHGDPPTLPKEGYSEEAHAFVRACLDKNPNNRPTYAMMLRHPWLAPLMKPPTASGEEEKGAKSPSTADQQSSESSGPQRRLSPSATEDKEVADWVKDALERRRRGLLGEVEKPPLHAAPLDAVPGSPLFGDPTTIFPA